VNTSFVYVEPPVRNIWRPRRFSWTEFQFPRLQVEPVDIFIDKMFRKIAEEFGTWNEL